MASLVVLLVAAVFTVIDLSAAQNCNSTAQTQYVLSLGNIQTCALEFMKVNNTPNTLDGMKALDNICVEGCAGAVTSWLANPTTCNDTFEAAGLTFWCQPADNGSIPRCRFALDQIDANVFGNQNIMQCASWMGTTCPDNCAEGLADMSTKIGCCFRNIYSLPDVRVGLVAQGLITENQSAFFGALSNTSLWTACGTPYPDVCTSNPFPASVLVTVTDPPVITTTAGTVGMFSFSLAITIALCGFALVF